MNLEFKQFKLKKSVGEAYSLTPLELKEYIDFKVKRIYFLSEAEEGAFTGSHCHKIERELFVLLQGDCILEVDYGDGKKDIPLQGSDSAVYLGPYVWHHFKSISSDAIILALSSTNYSSDRSDYVEDYSKYKEIVNNLIS